MMPISSSHDPASSSGGYAAEGASEHLTLVRRTEANVHNNTADGAPEHSTLFNRTEAQAHKKAGGKHGRKKDRDVLNKVIEGGRSVEFRADGTSFYMDDANVGASEHIGTWSDWKTYIANHEPDVISDIGIVRLTCEFIANMSDPNRGGMCRCDFVVYSADGSFWRLHPGGRGADAAPVYFEPQALAEQVLESTEPVEWTAAELWRNNLPHTYGDAMRLAPQVDRVGKKEVWG